MLPFYQTGEYQSFKSHQRLFYHAHHLDPDLSADSPLHLRSDLKIECRPVIPHAIAMHLPEP